MNDDLTRLREVFLTGVDEETKAENLAQIEAWETELAAAEEYGSWHEHDFTKRIMDQARKSYVELSLTLARDRTLTDAERASIHARQDAMLWLLSLNDRDPKRLIGQINAEIRRALTAVS